MNENPAWLKNLFRWEQKTLRVNGHSMAYVDEGDADAPPVLLLHGNPTRGFLYRDTRLDRKIALGEVAMSDLPGYRRDIATIAPGGNRRLESKISRDGRLVGGAGGIRTDSGLCSLLLRADRAWRVPRHYR